MNYNNDSDGRKKTFNEINITPLTDIFLVLLIIMMVIAPSFQSANSEISVPEINSGLSVETKNATISITKDGVYYLNDKQITCDSLTESLQNIIDKLEKKEVVVRADKLTKSSEILNVMKAAQDVGFEKLVVAGEPLTKKQQEKLKDMNAEEQEDQDEQTRSNVSVPSEG